MSTLPMPAAVGLALGFVAISLLAMVAICRLHRPEAERQPAPPLQTTLGRRTRVLRVAGRTVGVAGVGLMLGAGIPSSRLALLWTHRTALAALLVFLFLAQHQQVRAIMLCRRRAPLEAVARSYLQLWRLSEAAPAPVALLLAGSGIALASRGYSLATGWLCALVLAFSFLFFDGILGFTPLAGRLRNAALQAVETGRDDALRALVTRVSTNATVTAHFASFPLLFVLGWFKPALPNPLASPITSLERLAGTRLAAAALIALGGLLVIAVRSVQRAPP